MQSRTRTEHTNSARVHGLPPRTSAPSAPTVANAPETQRKDRVRASSSASSAASARVWDAGGGVAWSEAAAMRGVYDTCVPPLLARVFSQLAEARIV